MTSLEIVGVSQAFIDFVKAKNITITSLTKIEHEQGEYFIIETEKINQEQEDLLMDKLKELGEPI